MPSNDRLREVRRRAQQHRRVAVVAAGVHLAGWREWWVKSFFSWIGSASMSALRPMARLLVPARSTPTTPVLPTPRWVSMPSASSRSATSAAVRCSSKASSGWAWMSRRIAVVAACSARDLIE